jgi:hypothetical protein
MSCSSSPMVGEDTVGYRCPAARPRAYRTRPQRHSDAAPLNATDRYARFLTTDLSAMRPAQAPRHAVPILRQEEARVCQVPKAGPPVPLREFSSG